MFANILFKASRYAIIHLSQEIDAIDMLIIALIFWIAREARGGPTPKDFSP